jgi:hypothetical protein
MAILPTLIYGVTRPRAVMQPTLLVRRSGAAQVAARVHPVAILRDMQEALHGLGGPGDQQADDEPEAASSREVGKELVRWRSGGELEIGVPGLAGPRRENGDRLAS